MKAEIRELTLFLSPGDGQLEAGFLRFEPNRNEALG
jgi:hypothetical protein